MSLNSSTFFFGKSIMKPYVISLSHNNIAQNIAAHFQVSLQIINATPFADGESNFSFHNWSSFKDQSVIIVHSTGKPANDNIMSLMLLVDILKKHGALTITAVIPYFGYARQCQTINHNPGSVQAIIRSLELMGIDEFVMVELHNPEIIALFNRPVINVLLPEVVASHIKLHIPDYQQYCIVAPDHGAHYRAQTVAALLGLDLFACNKKRFDDEHVQVECPDRKIYKKAIIVDDIISTGHTVNEVIKQLADHGMQQGWGYFIHPVFAQNSLDIVTKNPFFEKIVVGNTLPLAQCPANILVMECSQAIIQEL